MPTLSLQFRVQFHRLRWRKILLPPQWEVRRIIRRISTIRIRRHISNTGRHRHRTTCRCTNPFTERPHHHQRNSCPRILPGLTNRQMNPVS